MIQAGAAPVPDEVISCHAAHIVELTAFTESDGPVRRWIDAIATRHDVAHVAPGRWWILSEARLGAVTDGLDPKAVATVDLSSSRVAFRLRHPRWCDVIAKGCGIDLAGAAFVERSYAFTKLAHFDVLLRARQAAGGCDLYVSRSYADSLGGWLKDALAEFEKA